MSCCIVAYSLHYRSVRFTATHHAATMRRRNLYKTDFLYSSLTQRGRRASAIKSAPTEAVGALFVPMPGKKLLNHNPVLSAIMAKNRQLDHAALRLLKFLYVRGASPSHALPTLGVSQRVKAFALTLRVSVYEHLRGSSVRVVKNSPQQWRKVDKRKEKRGNFFSTPRSALDTLSVA